MGGASVTCNNQSKTLIPSTLEPPAAEVLASSRGVKMFWQSEKIAPVKSPARCAHPTFHHVSRTAPLKTFESWFKHRSSALLPRPCLFEEKAPEFDVKRPHALDFRRPRELYWRDCAPNTACRRRRPIPGKDQRLRGTPAAFTAGDATKQAMMTDGATYGPDASYRDSDGVGGGLTKGKWQA